jgi:hypothetical protein
MPRSSAARREAFIEIGNFVFREIARIGFDIIQRQCRMAKV